MAIVESRTSSACDTCPARCCTKKFGYTSISLTADEEKDPLFKDHLDARGSFKLTGRFCQFLDADTHRCSIYERRPAACRGFVCHDTKNQGDNVIAMVYRNRDLREHLKSLDLLPKLDRDLFWAENAERVPTGVTAWSQMEGFNNHDPGTLRFFKLDAETGEISLEGRRRSTNVPMSDRYRMYVNASFASSILDPDVAETAVACDPASECGMPKDEELTTKTNA